MTNLEDPTDRRRHVRTAANHPAALLLGVGRDVFNCIVLDESESGVQIDLGELLDLPEQLIIRFSTEASLLVRRCWTAGTRAGLQFIETFQPAIVPPLPRLHRGKQILDYSLGALLIVFFLPLFAIIAIIIKFDSSGPVLFRQPRRGLQTREFMVFKFRTMHTHCCDLKADRQTSRDDPRVTRTGRWLRRLSIDELPQLLNVMRGEMSLVGPRPHTSNTRVEGELLQAVNHKYLYRYCVKPGITGWAQVNGARGELVKREDLRRRIAYDLEYIERISLLFDLKVLMLTCIREIISRNAF